MSVIKGVIVKTTAPTVNDDGTKGFYVGFSWVNSATNTSYKCIDNTTANAVWKSTSNAGFSIWRVAYANDAAETTSTSYTIVSEMIFGGTTMLGTPTEIKALLEMTGATTMDCRIYDVTNAQVIAEKTGNSVATATIVNLGTVSNLSTTEAIWEVQILRTGGTGTSRARVHSLQIM